MIDRRSLPGLAGAALAALAGIAAAAGGAPVAGALAAAGAVAAAAALLVVADRRSHEAAGAARSAALVPAGNGEQAAGAPTDEPGPGAADPAPAPATPHPARSSGAERAAPPVPPVEFTPHRTGPTGAEALTDDETGLFSEDYFSVAIGARVAAARRHLRPVAVVLLHVVQDLHEGRPRPCPATTVAEGLRTTLREADTACRMRDGTFALVLEDTPENGAIWTVERLRRHLATTRPGLTLWAGIACYPAHAFDDGALLSQASRALRAAEAWRQDRIEVAAGE